MIQQIKTSLTALVNFWRIYGLRKTLQKMDYLIKHRVCQWGYADYVQHRKKRWQGSMDANEQNTNHTFGMVCFGENKLAMPSAYPILHLHQWDQEKIRHFTHIHTIKYLVICNDHVVLETFFQHAILHHINDSTDFAYTDHYCINNNNQIQFVNLKPAWSPDTLRAFNYIGDVVIIAPHILDTLNINSNTSHLDYDLILQLCDAAQHHQHIPELTYKIKPSTHLFDKENDSKALQRHCTRKNLVYNAITVNKEVPLPIYTIKYTIHNKPLVSIIIPNREQKNILEACIQSILELSTYLHYEIIIVENNSQSQDIFNYYDILSQNPKIRIERLVLSEFNFSLLCNHGARIAEGDMLLFLNTDTKIITPDWLENMLMYAQREDIGVVGAKLYFSNEFIQHVGIAYLQHTLTSTHALSKIFHAQDVGYNYRLCVPYYALGATGACIMVKKNDYDNVGGMDEVNFKVICNETDLCLKLYEQGKKTIICPDVELFHYESLYLGKGLMNIKKGKIEKQEHDMFVSKWKPYFADPYFNQDILRFKALYKKEMPLCEPIEV